MAVRELDIIVGGRDETRVVFNSVRRNIAEMNQQIQTGQRSMRAFYQTQARQANRTGFEQATRDRMASLIKAKRAAELEARVDEAAFGRLLGGRAVWENAGKEAGDATAKGWMDQLKSQLGKRSFVGQLGSLLKGGGAIAGASVIAGVFGHAAAEAKLLADEIGYASIKGADLVDRGLAAIPVWGKVYRGFTDLGEVLDGSAMAAGRLRAQLEAVAALREQIKQVGDATKQAFDPIIDAGRAAGRSGPELMRTMADIQFERSGETIEAMRRPIAEASAKLVSAPLSPQERAELRAEITAMKREMENADFARRDKFNADMIKASQVEVKARHDAEQKVLDEDKKAMDETERRMKERRKDELDHVDDVRKNRKDMLGDEEKRMKERRREEEKRVEKSLDEVKQIKESIMTPAQKIDQERERIERLQRLGMISDAEAKLAIDAAIAKNRGQQRFPTIEPVSGQLISSAGQIAKERAAIGPMRPTVKTEPNKAETDTEKHTRVTAEQITALVKLLADPNTGTTIFTRS